MKRVLLVLFIATLPLLAVVVPANAMEIDGSDPRDPDLVYLEIRPALDEVDVAGYGVPTPVQIAAGGGIFKGFSLPVWNAGGNVNEELFYRIRIPDRWDGEHDPVVEAVVALAGANEAGNTYQLDLSWEKVTPNDEAVPAAFHGESAQRYTLSNTQYYCYRDFFVIDYDAPLVDPLLAEDILSIRLRLGSVGGQYSDLDDELIILHLGVLFPRGDMLGEEAEMEDIGVSLFMLVLAILALGLTVAMFATKEAMLGFPCVIFWAVLGGYAYGQFTTPWVDWQFYLAIASLLGMVPFTALAAFGLREKRDTIAEADLEEEDEGGYIDEGESEDEEGKPNDRTKALRERAKGRRGR